MSLTHKEVLLHAVSLSEKKTLIDGKRLFQSPFLF